MNKTNFLKEFHALQQQCGTWDNHHLMTFLAAMEGWIEDMEGYYINTHQLDKLKRLEQFDWDILQDMLIAATMYE